MFTYGAASKHYNDQETLHNITASYIVLTPGQPVLTLTLKSECQLGSSLFFSMNLFMFLEVTLYEMSYSDQGPRL